jgi:hypothetical protein
MELDLSRLPLPVRRAMDDIFRKDFDLRILKAVQEQTRTAAARRDRVRWSDDFVPQHEVNPMIDALWCHVYGRNYSQNPDLMKFLRRRNPEIALRPRSPKIQVGYYRQQPRRRVRFAPGTMTFAK